MVTQLTEQVPTDVAASIRRTKLVLRDQIGDVEAAFSEVEEFIAGEVADIAAARSRGEDVWPAVDYTDVAAGRVSAEDVAKIRRRGCLVVRGHFPWRPPVAGIATSSTMWSATASSSSIGARVMTSLARWQHRGPRSTRSTGHARRCRPARTSGWPQCSHS
jgi:hypothetical protein